MAITITPPDVFTYEEDLATFALRRKKELEAQISALRGLLVPKEAELDQINQVIATLGHNKKQEPSESDFTDGQQVDPPHAATLPKSVTINGYAVHLTIKEMILSALRDHFHEGATPSELSEYFRMVYSKDVDRNSISPQLARLREEGLVENINALSGKWQIVGLRGTIANAIAETEKKNLNALASPRRPSRLDRARGFTSKDIFE